MEEKKTLVELWEQNGQKPFYAVDDANFAFYCIGVAPNQIAMGWGKNGRDHAFGGLSKEWFKREYFI